MAGMKTALGIIQFGFIISQHLFLRYLSM